MVNKSYRKNSFETALREATNRLKEAREEHVRAQGEVLSLESEIPALEQTIAALQRQLNPYVPSHDCVTQVIEQRGGTVPLPPEIAQLGSEEDLLPEPEGKELIPE